MRAIEAFVGALDLKQLGFNGVDPHATGRPAYHLAVLLKIYIYGYLNRIQSRPIAAKLNLAINSGISDNHDSQCICRQGNNCSACAVLVY